MKSTLYLSFTCQVSGSSGSQKEILCKSHNLYFFISSFFSYIWIKFISESQIIQLSFHLYSLLNCAFHTQKYFYFLVTIYNYSLTNLPSLFFSLFSWLTYTRISPSDTYLFWWRRPCPVCYKVLTRILSVSLPDTKCTSHSSDGQCVCRHCQMFPEEG